MNNLDLTEENVSDLLTSISKVGDTKSDLLKEKLEELSRNELNRLWQRITTILKDSSLDDSFVASVLKGAVTVCSTYIHCDKPERSLAFSDSVFQLHLLLDKDIDNCNDEDVNHGSSKDNSSFFSTLKNGISLLCEEYYVKDWPKCQELLPILITYLLVESLKPNSKDSLIKRLYGISKGFDQIDLFSTGTSFNHDLLLRCFIHPTFLKCSEGQKLLAVIGVASEGKRSSLVVFVPVLIVPFLPSRNVFSAFRVFFVSQVSYLIISVKS
jgi:hypothetical protein